MKIDVMKMCSFLWISYNILLFLATILPGVSSMTSITDATSNFVSSTEAAFDYMVELEDNLWFHWNGLTDNGSFHGKLIHTADSEEQAPSWLGFGIYRDNQGYATLPQASDAFMLGSTAIIGIVTVAESPIPAQHYHLTTQSSSEGIDVLSDDKAYKNANILQHDSSHGMVVTELTFTKEMHESVELGANIRDEGVNVFLWAVGPAMGKSSESLGMHSMKGVIFLNFVEVRQKIEESSNPTYSIHDSEENRNPAPAFSGRCGSYLLDGKDAGYVTLRQGLEFHWKLIDRGTKIQIALSYTGDEAWLGVAISKNGRMVGSSAVIGAVDGDDDLGISPTHYSLIAQDISGVVPDFSILLEDTSITSSISSKDSLKTTTVLKFTRPSNTPNESLLIDKGRTTFLYAIGASRELAYHEHRGAFQIDLEKCGGTIVEAGAWTRVGIFAAHGVFASVAWVLTTPFAVSVAWFRTLVPTSWIYIHVFANMFTFVSTIICFVLVVVGISKEDAADHFSKPHHWVGLILVTLSTFQVVNGFFRPPAQRRDDNRLEIYNRKIFGMVNIPRTSREIWQLLHRVSGIIAVMLGVYQVQSGLELYSLRFDTLSLASWYWMYVAMFVFGLVGLKIWVRIDGGNARSGIMQAVSTTDKDRDEGEGEGDDEADEDYPEMELPSQNPNNVLKGTMS